MADTGVLFEAHTPLGFAVRVTTARWELIATMKHPVMAGRESTVRLALENPEEIRAFLITAYLTDAIKEGTRIWPK